MHKHNMGNIVYYVGEKPELMPWMDDLSSKNVWFRNRDDGIEINRGGVIQFVPVGDCIVYANNGLLYSCTKEHAEMEGWI